MSVRVEERTIYLRFVQSFVAFHFLRSSMLHFAAPSPQYVAFCGTPSSIYCIFLNPLLHLLHFGEPPPQFVAFY